MDIRPITETYSVSPQISVEDVQTLADNGFTTVICNRPDAEIPPSHHADVIQQAVEALGMRFVDIPINPGGLSQDVIASHKEAIDSSEGPVFAYCASGNRSTLIWALTQAGLQPTDTIIAAGAAQGYDVEILRGMINMIASQKS